MAWALGARASEKETDIVSGNRQISDARQLHGSRCRGGNRCRSPYHQWTGCGLARFGCRRAGLRCSRLVGFDTVCRGRGVLPICFGGWVVASSRLHAFRNNGAVMAAGVGSDKDRGAQTMGDAPAVLARLTRAPKHAGHAADRRLFVSVVRVAQGGVRGVLRVR
jgi:hypothetical protein